MKSVAIILAFITILLLVVSCGHKAVEPTPEERLRALLAQTPRENEEAEMAALWVSGALVASKENYDKMKNGFELLRRTRGDVIPLLREIRFTHPLEPSQIRVWLSESASSLLRDSSYHAWDSLNHLYSATVIDTASPMGPARLRAMLRFRGRLNPDTMVAYYSLLPGVTCAEAIPIRDQVAANLYPWINEDGSVTFVLSKVEIQPTFELTYNFWCYKVTPDFAEYRWRLSYTPNKNDLPVGYVPELAGARRFFDVWQSHALNSCSQ